MFPPDLEMLLRQIIVAGFVSWAAQIAIKACIGAWHG